MPTLLEHCAWEHRRTTAELEPFGATPLPRPPSEGRKASSSNGMFLIVQVFQLQDSLKAFLMVSFGRNVNIYLICQDLQEYKAFLSLPQMT